VRSRSVTKVHRRTVREALASAVPKSRKPRVAQAPKLDPVKPLIDAMLLATWTLRVRRAIPRSGFIPG
jgi:hypothetical protein